MVWYDGFAFLLDLASEFFFVLVTELQHNCGWFSRLFAPPLPSIPRYSLVQLTCGTNGPVNFKLFLWIEIWFFSSDFLLTNLSKDRLTTCFVFCWRNFCIQNLGVIWALSTTSQTPLPVSVTSKVLSPPALCFDLFRICFNSCWLELSMGFCDLSKVVCPPALCLWMVFPMVGFGWYFRNRVKFAFSPTVSCLCAGLAWFSSLQQQKKRTKYYWKIIVVFVVVPAV